MGEFARDEDLKIHGVHPSQQQGGGGQGTEMRLPGGGTGQKR